jgi:SET domain-containing protein
MIPEQKVQVQKDGNPRLLTLPEFEAVIGAAFIPRLEFESDAVIDDIREKTQKIHKKGEISKEQLWLGAYYKKEIESMFLPEVTVRWIDDSIGWGVFAAKAFKKREFIAEYSGKVRPRRRQDKNNAYCFEYIVAPHVPTRYSIDAETQGGIGRLINHSDRPNLLSALATFESVSHVILIASAPIRVGEQLCYDYGPDYWSRRSKPALLHKG